MAFFASGLHGVTWMHPDALLILLKTPVGNIILFIVLVALTLTLRLIVVRTLFPAIEKLSSWPTGLSLRKLFVPTVGIGIFMLTVRAALPLFGFTNSVQVSAYHVVDVLLIAAMTWVVLRTLTVIKLVAFSTVDINTPDNLEQRKQHTRILYLTRIGYIVIGTLGLCVALMRFEPIRAYGIGILTSAGLAGVILGFAAQKSLSNLIAGFLIAFSQPLRIDDVVIVENEWGRIEEITLIYVVVRLWDDRRLVVPVHYFLEKPFQNWTRTSSSITGSIFLYFDYSIPVDKLRTFFQEQLAKSPLWDGRVAVLQVTEAMESTVQIRGLMSARNSADAFDLRCDIRELVLSYVREQFPGALPKARVSLDRAEAGEHSRSGSAQ